MADGLKSYAQSQHIRGGAVPWSTGRTPSSTYGEKRVCASEDCATTLSRYNPGDHCSTCNDPRDVRYPGQHRS